MKELVKSGMVCLVADVGKKSLLVTKEIAKLSKLEQELLQVHSLSDIEKLEIRLAEMSDEEREFIKQVFDKDTKIKNIKAYTKRNLHSPKKVYRRRDYM